MLRKKEFLTGLLLAAMIGLALFEPFVTMAARKTGSDASTFMKRFDMFSGNKLTKSFLNKNASSDEFCSALGTVLFDLELIDSPDTVGLVKSGILMETPKDSDITRENAAILVLRSVMAAWGKQAIPRPDEVEYSVPFSDWQIDSKYLSTLIFAKTAGIVNGAGNNNFRPADALKRREAVHFLMRIHSFVSQYKTGKVPVIFADVAEDHFMLDPINDLQKAGAFDYTNFGGKLMPTKSISVGDMTLVAQGIVAKHSGSLASSAISKLARIKNSCPANTRCNRNTLAVIAAVAAEVLNENQLSAGASNEGSAPSLLLFEEKGAAVVDAEAVRISVETLAKIGIKLGYRSGFKGEEAVSRYEALGVFSKIIDAPAASIKPAEKNAAATKSDVEAFAQRLREKRAAVRRILNREK